MEPPAVGSHENVSVVSMAWNFGSMIKFLVTFSYSELYQSPVNIWPSGAITSLMAGGSTREPDTTSVYRL